MGKTTGISWCDSTFNPWIGCTKVGPGCDHCYAEAMNKWVAGGANWGPGAPRRRMSEKYLRQPLAWNATALKRLGRRQRVFCASHADLFDNEVPQEWRDQLWPMVEQTHNLEWQFVTKRVGNVAKMVPERWRAVGFPRNVIVIATVVDQTEYDRDWPKLLALPCRRGLSIEPQLGAIVIDDCEPGDLAWAIGGGESKQGGGYARPYHLRWPRSLIGQARRLGIAYFQKQLGGTPVHDSAADMEFITRTMDPKARANPAEWPVDLRVQEFPA